MRSLVADIGYLGCIRLVDIILHSQIRHASCRPP